MKTKAVRLYGEKDLRLEEFDLPDIKEDEILAHVMVDSLCMSSYKALNLGKNHKRVPEDVAENPVIIGLSGKINIQQGTGLQCSLPWANIHLTQQVIHFGILAVMLPM
jgi:hypothetical protein